MKVTVLFFVYLLFAIVGADHDHGHHKNDKTSREMGNSTEDSTESKENDRPRQPGHGKPALIASFYGRQPWHPWPYFGGGRPVFGGNSTTDPLESAKNLTEAREKALSGTVDNAEAAPEVSNLIKTVGQTETVPSPMPGVDTATIKEFTTIVRNKTIDNLKVMPYSNTVIAKTLKKRDAVDDAVQEAENEAYEAEWDLDVAFRDNLDNLDMKKRSVPVQNGSEIGDEVHLLPSEDGYEENITEPVGKKSKSDNSKQVVRDVVKEDMESPPEKRKETKTANDSAENEPEQIFKVVKTSAADFGNETDESSEKVAENGGFSNEDSEELAKEIIREEMLENCTDDLPKTKNLDDSQVYDPEFIILDKKENDAEDNSTDSFNHQKINDSVDLGENFKVVHKIGKMPAALIIDPEENEIENSKPEANYKFMDDLRDEMDKYEKDKKDKSYLMIEEVIDPIEDRKQFTILRPSYRDLTPNENPVIKKIQETLENRIKRGTLPGLSPETKEWVKKWKERFQNNENSQKEDFPAPKPLEIGSEDGSILKKVADAIEDSDSASKTDQKPKMSEVFEVGSESGEKPVDLPQDDNGMRKGKLDGTKSMSQMIADRLGLPEDKGPIMIEPEGQILPLTLDYFTYEDAEIPSKVVVETKKKMTIIYDDGAEESNSKQSSEEHETNQLLKPSKEASEANILGNSQVQAAKTVKMESHDRLPVPADNPAVDPISSGKSDFAEATKQFSKNFVLTLSVSPLMFSIMAGFCLLILIIKAYFLYFPRHKRATLPPQKSEPPISVITVQKPLP